MGGRGPGGDRDFQDFDLRRNGQDTSVNPGERQSYCSSRTLDRAGSYRFYVTYSATGEDRPEAWVYLTSDKYLTARSPRQARLTVASAPSFSPSQPRAGDEVRACATVLNDGDLAYQVAYFGIGGRGPDGPRDLQDFPLRRNGQDTLIGGGQRHEYCESQRLTRPGTYRFYIASSGSGVDTPEAWTHLTGDVDLVVSSSGSPAPPPDQSSVPYTGSPRRGEYFRLPTETLVRAGNGLRYPPYPNSRPAGTTVKIIGGPRYADGFEWWDLSEEEWGGGTGWFAFQPVSGPPVPAVVSGPLLQVVESLTLSNLSPNVDQEVTASVTVRNVGTEAITVRDLRVSGRGPGGDRDVQDFPSVGSLTFQPGSTYPLARKRAFGRWGDYHFSVEYQASDGGWHAVPGLSGITPTAQLTVQPVLVGQKTDADFLRDLSSYGVAYSSAQLAYPTGRSKATDALRDNYVARYGKPASLEELEARAEALMDRLMGEDVTDELMAETIDLTDFMSAELIDPRLVQSIAVGHTPILGDLYDLSVFVSGYDPIYDEHVGWVDRVISGAATGANALDLVIPVAAPLTEQLSGADKRAGSKFFIAVRAMQKGIRLHQMVFKRIREAEKARYEAKILRLNRRLWAPNHETIKVLDEAKGVWKILRGDYVDYENYVIKEYKSGVKSDTAIRAAYAQTDVYAEALWKSGWKAKNWQRMVVWVDDNGVESLVARPP